MNETDIDCGGDCLTKEKRCSVSMVCVADSDCISGACGKNSTCVCEYLYSEDHQLV